MGVIVPCGLMKSKTYMWDNSNRLDLGRQQARDTLWHRALLSYRGRVTRRVRPWLPALGWAGVLFVLSSIPGNDFPQVPGAQTDKLVHGVLYLVLGALAVRGLW